MRLEESKLPPSERIDGEHGDELVVVSKSEIRSAELLEQEKKLQTADGWLTGRKGDVVITMDSGEQYPITANVFYGTYEVLGQVGNRLVARRLLHSRRAWPITSNDLEYDYGPGRGRVAAARGGWLYRSDDDVDGYGVINGTEATARHSVAGPLEEVNRQDWGKCLSWATLLVTALSPLLTLFALLAFVFIVKMGWATTGRVLLTLEALLLIAGVFTAVHIKRNTWSLRAAVQQGTRLASELQVACELLGQQRSALFPNMTLWRAAQSPAAPTSGTLSGEKLRDVQDQIRNIHERTREGVAKNERRTKVLLWATNGAALVAIIGAVWVAYVEEVLWLEVLGIWLPSVIGALHALWWIRGVHQRMEYGRSFLSELDFVRTQLLDLLPAGKTDMQATDPNAGKVLAAVRALCGACARDIQREMQMGIAEHPEPPV